MYTCGYYRNTKGKKISWNARDKNDLGFTPERYGK
jgi:hypothetical protein